MSKHPLPEKFVEIRPHQQQALDEINELFDAGKDVVVVDAPTGSGKSLLGELVRRDDFVRNGEIGMHRTAYLCGTKGLQDQFAADFPYGNVIKGRANYPTQHGDEVFVTCDDCLGAECHYCDSTAECPYVRAKSRAVTGELIIANYSYLLREANSKGDMSGNQLAIADECDLLEGEMLRFSEFYVSARRLERLGLDAPKKGVHKPTLARWLEEELAEAARVYAKKLDPYDVRGRREIKQLNALVADCKRVAAELDKDVAAKDIDEESGKWVRDYPGRDDVLSLKPVVVKRYGLRQLFRHAERWLMMSATVISADEMMDSLGAAGLDYGVVSVPMMFDVERRKVFVTPLGSMSRKMYNDTLPKIVRAVERICERHPGERVLVHTHTYKLARELSSMCRLAGRPVFTYSSGGERDDAFKRYARAEGSVMFAPSMDRGYDFHGDLARVIVIAKVPYPYLGDRQINARMRLPGGQNWYTVQTVRSIVQMTGRGVRSAEDHAVSYVLDQDFLKTFREGRSLFPRWWSDAVDMTFPVRELL